MPAAENKNGHCFHRAVAPMGPFINQNLPAANRLLKKLLYYFGCKATGKRMRRLSD